MRHLHWKLLVAVFVFSINNAAIGEEDAPDVDDVLGIVDDKLIGIWEWTGPEGFFRMYLRPDGIAIFNGYETGDPNPVSYVSVCRYGVSGGYIAMGESTDFTFEEGEWEEYGIYEEWRYAQPYDITDTTLTLHPPEGGGEQDGRIYTKSNAEILVPDKVILYDGSTSVETHSWGRIKAGLTH